MQHQPDVTLCKESQEEQSAALYTTRRVCDEDKSVFMLKKRQRSRLEAPSLGGPPRKPAA